MNPRHAIEVIDEAGFRLTIFIPHIVWVSDQVKHAARAQFVENCKASINTVTGGVIIARQSRAEILELIFEATR